MSTWNFAVLVDAIARETPDHVAVVHGARRVTWQDLASTARAFAWHLQRRVGLGPGDKVVIALPNCPGYIETYVAVRKARAVALSVSPSASPDALHGVVDASDAKVVVCAPSSAEAVRLAARRIQKRWRPTIVEVVGSIDGGATDGEPPTDWAVEQPSADDLIFLATRVELSAGTAVSPIVLPVAPLSTGNSLAVALRALTAGGRVVFIDSARFDPTLIWQTVEREHADTMAIAGDAFARPLLAALQSTTPPLRLPTLRTISSSGAALSPDVVSGLRAALGAVTVVDDYAGAGDEPVLTTQKVRPSDVEARLLKHKSIAECLVIGVSDPRVGKKVVAIVRVEPDHFLDAAELAAWCRARLPSTMTPGAFVFVEKIDRSPSGAPDYEALRRVAIDRLVREP